MRLTTLSLLGLTACVPQVGGGPSDRGHDPTGDCEEVHDSITIRNADDFDQAPNGCWDLYGPLVVEGSAITSLAKLGDLRSTDDFTLDGTNVAAIDTPSTVVVYGKLTISGNARLANLVKLEVEKPDGIHIDNNAELASLDKVTETTLVGGHIMIDSNPKLSKVEFPRLQKVEDSIEITSNPALTTATFAALQYVNGPDLEISNNALLASIDFSKVQKVGSIEIANNLALASLGGLYATEIANLTIRGNTALTSLGSFSSLERILGNLVIDDNDGLTNIAMFTGSMKYVTGFVDVTNNDHLTDLGQMSHMLGMGAITITTNPALSVCRAREVEACVPQHGNVNIQFNQTASNCSYWCQQ